MADAWLERLPLSERIAAQAHTDARLVAWLAVGAGLTLACALIARAGLAGRLRRRIESGKPRPWLASLAVAASLALVLAALRSVIDGVAGWRMDDIRLRGGGVAVPAGLADHLILASAGVLPCVVAAALLVPPLMWLMRLRPKTWPAIAGGLLIAACLALFWAPYAFSTAEGLAPAPQGPVRAGLMQLIAESGLPARQVYASADPEFDADVTGGFGRATVIVGPRLLAAPPAEARAYVGHLMGHYAHSDILVVSLLAGLAGGATLFAVQRWAAPLVRRLGERDAASAADPEALPGAAVIGLLGLAAITLVFAGYLRWANVRADQYSLDHAREPDGLAAVIEREWDHEAVAPSAVETALFYTHPPLGERLTHAMRWKAAQGR
jgi:STE24 endopeptidase